MKLSANNAPFELCIGRTSAWACWKRVRGASPGRPVPPWYKSATIIGSSTGDPCHGRRRDIFKMLASLIKSTTTGSDLDVADVKYVDVRWRREAASSSEAGRRLRAPHPMSLVMLGARPRPALHDGLISCIGYFTCSCILCEALLSESI